jgi:N-acetylglucosaminyldiphosphoundecaprenol N-acetyl-beta-D-mannosaminyltransferase
METLLAKGFTPARRAQPYRVLGLPIGPLQIPELIQCMQGWIADGSGTHCITFANVHVIMEARRDPGFRDILQHPDVLTVPDGTPLIWLGRARGVALKRRVYGPDLMHDFFAATVGKGYRHFFYGGAPGVAEQLAATLAAKFPGFELAGLYSPPYRPLSPVEDARVVETINAARPDIVWIGLGCPKQEKWMFEHRRRLRAPVLAAVGQAFDIHAGAVRQAPAWMREHGLEWLFRLAREPRRLWKRYLVYNSLFLWSVLLERLGAKRYSGGDLPCRPDDGREP